MFSKGSMISMVSFAAFQMLAVICGVFISRIFISDLMEAGAIKNFKFPDKLMILWIYDLSWLLVAVPTIWAVALGYFAQKKYGVSTAMIFVSGTLLLAMLTAHACWSVSEAFEYNFDFHKVCMSSN